MSGRLVKTDIRLSRLSGGTHLSWMVDELDLPWLLHVIRELDVEEDATVSLADPDGDGQLVVRVGEDGFAVERSSSSGGRARLARLPAEQNAALPAEENAADHAAGEGTGPLADTAVDFDAVSEVVTAFLQDRQPGGGLRWIGSASRARWPEEGRTDAA